MRTRSMLMWALGLLSSATLAAATSNDTSPLPSSLNFLELRDDRPDGCPPCQKYFDCRYDEFKCLQGANCTETNGQCKCPPGFGGDNCGDVLCGSLAEDKREVRTGDQCTCSDGWSGINCNVCTEDRACNALMESGEGGVCYKQGLVQKQHYQMCDVTNVAIRGQLKEKKPQVTFSCNATDATCNFQFWVDQRESFYCALDTCQWAESDTDSQNVTSYKCDHISCSCIPDRMLCGEAGSIDIGGFLSESIKGPASFVTQKTSGGDPKDGSRFEEKAMNGLISSVFGDEYITLDCFSGECVHSTQVPGYEKPIKKINTPLIAGVIAGCSLFILAVGLILWYLSRRAAVKKGGYIRVGEDGDADPAKLINHKPMALQFQNVSYSLRGKQILNKISGIVQPGQVMAIMGASGAGKSTFLDILARKNKRGEVTGNTYVNGEKVLDYEYRNVIGFVDQEDTLLPTLTVHETIRTSAMLRLPADMKKSTKEQRVIEVMQQLGIHHIKDQLIGSEEGSGRGISGGEKRRVGIACELVTSPSILFLDEPTSGLDAFNAFNVIECLVTLAKTYNRTVVFTIHQPRSNIVALFDQLVLLAKGRAVYSGPFSECQSYFDSIGYACPPGFNIADYLVDLTMHASMPRSLRLDEDLVDGLNAAETDGLLDGDSSIRAIKSIKSTTSANASTLDSSDVSSRPQHKRKVSIKQQQDRLLFTRKSSETANPLAAVRDEEDSVSLKTRDTAPNGLQTSRRGSYAPQNLDEPDNTLPDFTSDLDQLVASFQDSRIFKATHSEIASSIQTASTANGHATPNGAYVGPVTGSIKGFRRIGLAGQFMILSQRTFRNLMRNPMLMLTHYAVAILLAVLSGWLYYGIENNIPGFQNRLGLFFFLLALFGFSTLTSLNTFASERLIFIRERANGYYSPLAYYLSKLLFDIVPLRLIPPILMGVIIYPMTGLTPQWPTFLRFMLILILFNLAAAAICLTIGIVFRDGAVANLLGSLVMLFSLLFAGLLLNLNKEKAQSANYFLQKFSIFHYGYEALIVNEVSKLKLIEHKYGLDIEVPGASILSSFGFDNLAMWNDIIGLGVFGATFIVIAYICMHYLLVEKR